MECAVCSTPVPEDSVYCHHCGSLVSDAEGQKAATAAMDDAAFRHVEKLLREDTAGEFEIERRLGRGGMAVVYLATEVHLGRQVAIKVLPPDLTFGHGVERFKREARTAATLTHPNIIPVYRVSSGARIFWYAMQFLEGKSLDVLMKEKKQFSLEETVTILKQVADALDYAHDRKVVHRDIKPANIMLDAQSRVILTDFGIAKALNEGTLTASGSAIGTPYYMSPEQAMGQVPTGAADQYSLAVTAYQMLAGQVPFEGTGAVDILHKHCMVPPSPLEILRPNLPNHAYLAVHKALEKEPQHRFSTVRAFVEGLTHHTSEMATTVIRNRPSRLRRLSRSIAAIPPGRRAWMLGGGATLLATVAVAFGMWLSGGKGTSALAGSGSEVEKSVTALPTDSSSGRAPGTAGTAPRDSARADTATRVAANKPDTARRVQPPSQTERATRPRRDSAPAPKAPLVVAKGVLIVRTTGGWANVSIDGTSKGESTYRDSLPVGRHTVKLERPGYTTIDTAAIVSTGDPMVLVIPMIKANP